MLLCELLQLLYYFYFFSSLCNFDPLCNIVIYFLLVLNFATVICVLSINVNKKKQKKRKVTLSTFNLTGTQWFNNQQPSREVKSQLAEIQITKPKHNLSRKDRQALKELQQNTGIEIKRTRELLQ